eukprot:TRINITY_DN13744_c0_g1_i1.p2 TRINITY_DN13744_c0_g1~~TRINITY_DN13744_c0_g1_i1.p2  ORF type:complete len:113 (-),score=36.50 TRINITY_DN13744_c0_g1_i1:330-668(-)
MVVYATTQYVTVYFYCIILHAIQIETIIFFFLMIRRPPRSTHCISSAASDVYKRQIKGKTKPAKALANMQIYDTSVEQGHDSIHPAFDKFFNALMMALYEKEEKEEKDILNN